MGLYLEVACKQCLWSGCLGKTRTACRGRETPLKRFVYVLSLLQAHPSIGVICE